MSRTLNAPRWGMGAAIAGAIACALMAFAAVCLAPGANAAFTTGKCQGEDITGRGASFARDAHNAFINNFGPFYCGMPAPTVTYEPLGSGEGRLSMKVRNGAPRFGMTDEPPTPAEIAQMNAGTGNEPAGNDTEPADNGSIHVIPAAVGAVAPLVNFPDGCDPTKLLDASKTSTDAKLVRVRFTKEQFEKVWAQGAAGAPMVTWRDVFGTLDDTAACKKPIIRVVRKDDSGTTFAFKDYLHALNLGRGWLSTYATGANKTLEWPGAKVGTAGQCSPASAPGEEVDTTDHLTSACSNNAENLTQKLIDTDGSIGYADVSTARAKGLAVNPAGGDVDTYWTQLENGSNAFVEPTFSANGYQTTGAKGANCQSTSFNNVPANTLGDWSKVSGVNAATGWGICTLTYGLVFDDNSDVWGNTPAEEAKARTVKDYWSNVVSAEAQAALFPNDYAPLPNAILTISKAGVEAVDWNKGEGGGNNGGGGGGNNGGNSGTANTAPLPVKPSNVFTVPRKSISSKTGGATVSVKLPGAGTFEMVGTAKVGKKQVKVGRVLLKANQAGTFNLSLKPSAAAKAQLREKGQLRVSLTLTFTPTGGDAKTSTTTLTLKLKKGK